jgi:hypothetical protein
LTEANRHPRLAFVPSRCSNHCCMRTKAPGEPTWGSCAPLTQTARRDRGRAPSQRRPSAGRDRPPVFTKHATVTGFSSVPRHSTDCQRCPRRCCHDARSEPGRIVGRLSREHWKCSRRPESSPAQG